MSLKTATLIALIGIIVHFGTSFLYFFNVAQLYQISRLLARTVSIFNSLIFNGSIILFLAVFYSKQKD